MWQREGLTRIEAGKAVDSVRAPAFVEPAEQRRQKAVGVLKQGHDTGQIVCADVLLARAPDRLECETSGKLGLEELKREALKG